MVVSDLVNCMMLSVWYIGCIVKGGIVLSAKIVLDRLQPHVDVQQPER